MTFRDGRIAAADGQLAPELRSRDLSGFPDQLHSLNELIDGIDPPCWADAQTAAALYGIRGFSVRAPFHLLTMRDRFVHRVGHHVRQTTDLPLIDRESAHGLASVSPTRALINMSKSETPERLEIALASAIEQGLTSDDLLHRRLSELRASGRHGLPRLLEMLERHELVAGGQSWLEREFLRLVNRAGLPQPETQQVLGRRGDRLIRVDFRWPGTQLVVEALGYRWHRTATHMTIDAERMNQLASIGYVCLQFTYQHVTSKPDYVIKELQRTLATQS